MQQVSDMIDFSNKLFTLPGDSWNYMPPIPVPSSAKRIGACILVIAKLNGIEDFVLRDCVIDMILLRKQLPLESL